jgi:hypothetical protein
MLTDLIDGCNPFEPAPERHPTVPVCLHHRITRSDRIIDAWLFADLT